MYDDDVELLDMYNTYLYYFHEIIYLNHRIDWGKLTADQLDRIVNIVCKEKEALQQILDEQNDSDTSNRYCYKTTNVTLT